MDPLMLDPKLVEILACPACDDRPPVRDEGEWLVCESCGRRYPVVDGIPEMLVESALPPDDRERKSPMISDQ